MPVWLFRFSIIPAISRRVSPDTEIAVEVTGDPRCQQVTLPTSVQFENLRTGLALDIAAPEVLAATPLRDDLCVVVLAPSTTHARTAASPSGTHGALSEEVARGCREGGERKG